MSKLSNKVALVTGGSRGIGAAIVKRLASDGATVAFTYVSAADKANALVTEVEKAGGKALAIKADSSDEKAIAAAVEQTVNTFGSLSILVNNAGVFLVQPVDSAEANAGEINRLFAINQTATFAAVRTAIKHLGEGGRIISIGSTINNRVGMSGLADYAASKAAVAAYTKGWAWDLGKKGITVNNVQPGPIDTDMNPDNSDFATTMKAGLALGRYGKADEVAAAVSFLASPEASYITGISLDVDGGYSA